MNTPKKPRRCWRSERVGVCSRCGREMAKRNMVALYVKESSYMNVALLCHLCRDCLPDLLDGLGTGMPGR